MTLILAVVTPSWAVQLSDMRLTKLSNQQEIISEHQIKSTVLMGPDFQGVVGFAGLARWNSHVTGDWLADQLANLAGRPVAELVAELTARATSQFASIDCPLTERRTFISLIGWEHGDSGLIPIAVRISNAEDKSGKTFSEAADHFSCFAHSWNRDRTPRQPKFGVVAMGEDRALRPGALKDIGRLLKRRPTADATLNALKQVMRYAADNKLYGHLIGRNWIGAKMDLSGSASASFFPENEGSPEIFAP